MFILDSKNYTIYKYNYKVYYSLNFYKFHILSETCTLSANSGSCYGRYPQWFINLTSSQCELFSYSCCGGNSNRFSTLEQCINTCGYYYYLWLYKLFIRYNVFKL